MIFVECLSAFDEILSIIAYSKHLHFFASIMRSTQETYLKEKLL